MIPTNQILGYLLWRLVKKITLSNDFMKISIEYKLSIDHGIEEEGQTFLIRLWAKDHLTGQGNKDC